MHPSTNTTPRLAGYRWPAEWEPQQSVWLAWPHDASLWPIDLDPIWDTIADLVVELGAVQRVDLLVQNRDVMQLAERSISEAMRRRNIERAKIVHHFIETDDSWLRDTGPIFINRAGEQAAVGWNFNGWGKFEPFDTDAKVNGLIAESAGVKLFRPEVVLEGGGIDTNGRGLVITTEQCLLNPNRNPGLNKRDYEKLLGDYLSAEQVVWLGEGLYNDHTDGHVDVVTRFTAPNAVVTLTTSDRNDPSYPALDENLRRLKAVRFDDQPLRIVELPLPDPVMFEGKRLAAGYANFVIANALIVVPTYDCDADREALRIIGEQFPDRRVIGLSAVELLKGGGAFHCLSQQQPASG